MVGQKKHSKNKNNKKSNQTQGETKAKQQQNQSQQQSSQQQKKQQDQANTDPYENVVKSSTTQVASSNRPTVDTKDQKENKNPVGNIHSTENAFISPKQKRALSRLISELHGFVCEKFDSIKDKWELFTKLYNIIQKIIDIEEPLNPFKSPLTTAQRLEKIENLYKWAKENGLETNGIEICEFPGFGLGLRTNKDLKKHDDMFSIPEKLIFTPKSDPDKLDILPANLNAAYNLMLEFLKPDSFWKPYIDLLPTEYNTCFYYTYEEMEMLKGSSVLKDFLNQYKTIAIQYSLMHILINKKGSNLNNPILEKFSYSLYRWAVSTVMTRQNILKDFKNPAAEERPNVSALIPFWDFANHRQGELTSFYCPEEKKMISSAQEDYQAGDQVFIYYGDRSNAEFLLHNAFVDENNPHDFIAIRLGLSPTDPLHDQRKKLLDLLEIGVTSILKVLPSPDCISPELLAYVRVFNMNESQLLHWIESGRHLDLLYLDCALDTDLEKKTWTYIQNRLMILLRSFPTTLETDKETLEKSGAGEVQLSSIAKMLLKYRITEKTILSEALEYAKQKVNA